jgi:hypothetical protein
VELYGCTYDHGEPQQRVVSLREVSCIQGID